MAMFMRSCVLLISLIVGGSQKDNSATKARKEKPLERPAAEYGSEPAVQPSSSDLFEGYPAPSPQTQLAVDANENNWDIGFSSSEESLEPNGDEDFVPPMESRRKVHSQGGTGAGDGGGGSKNRRGLSGGSDRGGSGMAGGQGPAHVDAAKIFHGF